MPALTRTHCPSEGLESLLGGVAPADARERTLRLVEPDHDEDLDRVAPPADEPAGLGPRAHRGVRGPVARAAETGGSSRCGPTWPSVYDADRDAARRARRPPVPAPRRGARVHGARCASARSRVLERRCRAGPASGEMLVQHEHQHNETMLQTLQLAEPGVYAPRARAPARPGRERRRGRGRGRGRFEIGRRRRRLRLRQRAPAPRRRAGRRSRSTARPVTNGAVPRVRRGRRLPARASCGRADGWELARARGLASGRSTGPPTAASGASTGSAARAASCP